MNFLDVYLALVNKMCLNYHFFIMEDTIKSFVTV